MSNKRFYKKVALTDSISSQNEEKDRQTNAASRKLYLGVFCALSAASIIPLANVFIKLGSFLNGIEHLFVFFTVKLIVVFVICLLRRVNPFGTKRDRFLLCARGLVGCLAMVLAYKAVALLPISNVAVLSHSTILMTAIIARFALDEKLGLGHIVAAVLSIVGIVCIAKPTFVFNSTIIDFNTTAVQYNNSEPNKNSDVDNSFNKWIGITCILTSTFLFGAVNVIIKKLSNSNADYLVVTVYDSYFGLPVAMGLVYFLLKLDPFETKRDLGVELDYFLGQLAFSFVSALLAIAGQALVTLAFRFIEANEIPIFRAFDVIVAFGLQVAILRIKIDFLSVVGSVSIILGILTLLLFSWLKNMFNKKNQRQDIIFEIIFFKF